MYGKTALPSLEQLELKELFECMDAKREKFIKGDELLRYGKRREYIFVILKGEANLVRIDYNGNRTVFERLTTGSIFSDIFISDTLSDFISVRCLCDCEILFINYNSLISPCSKMCSKHLMILSNITNIIVNDSASYNDRIDILSRRSTKDKLLAYFKIMSHRNKSNEFLLPISLSELADYLSVDRSAMMREIAKLKAEGIIKTDRRKILLLRSDS